jgi:hypothetical protein
MALLRLRRHAPEAQSVDTCGVCGARRPDQSKDHLLVGQPGTPSYNGAVCEACGTTIDQVANKFGGDLNITIEEAQREATDKEVTRGAKRPNRSR